MERILELCSLSSKSTADSELYVVLSVTISFLTCVFIRPITVLSNRYFQRRGWLPADVESQAPLVLNCQDRSSGVEGGSIQGLVDLCASVGGEAGPASGDPVRTAEAMECRMCLASEDPLLALAVSERRVWEGTR